MKITERIYDATSGKTTDVERELKPAEIAAYQAAEQEAATRKAAAEQEAQIKATAEAKLAALGITVDDLKALGL